MTIPFTLVFAILMVEIFMFLALVIPLPFTWRRKLFNFISVNPVVAKLQYGMKIAFIGISILFLDSVNRVYRVRVEQAASKSDSRGGTVIMGGSERMEVQSRKFYSERNMYLCGFTLFLSLILNRTFVMIMDVLRLEEELKMMKGDSAVKGKGGALHNVGDADEVGTLKEALARKERDMEILKKQVEGMQSEYNRLGDQVSSSGRIPKKSL